MSAQENKTCLFINKTRHRTMNMENGSNTPEQKPKAEAPAPPNSPLTGELVTGMAKLNIERTAPLRPEGHVVIIQQRPLLFDADRNFIGFGPECDVPALHLQSWPSTSNRTHAPTHGLRVPST